MAFDPEHLAAITEARLAREEEERQRIMEGGIHGAMIDAVQRAEKQGPLRVGLTIILQRLLLLLTLHHLRKKKALNSPSLALPVGPQADNEGSKALISAEFAAGEKRGEGANKDSPDETK